jgi:hypothetical protein
MIVTGHPSDCIINNDVRKLDISLSFLDKIGVIPTLPDVRPTWLAVFLADADADADLLRERNTVSWLADFG